MFKDWQNFRYKYGDKVARLSTRAFLSPLKEDEEITASMAQGRDVTIKYKAKGELQVPLPSMIVEIVLSTLQTSRAASVSQGFLFCIGHFTYANLPGEKYVQRCRRTASGRCFSRHLEFRGWSRWRIAASRPPPTLAAAHAKRQTPMLKARSARPWVVMYWMCAAPFSFPCCLHCVLL